MRPSGSEDGPSGKATSCGPWRDSTVFAANHAAHRTFFAAAFPEFIVNRNPFYIVGESYAGIYVPGWGQCKLDPRGLAAPGFSNISKPLYIRLLKRNLLF